MLWPTAPPTWLLPWLIWRFRHAGIPGAPPVPAGTPREIPPWAWGVAKWCGWRRKGAIPPRPASTAKAPIPTKIPRWGWQTLNALDIAVPRTPPPPPPPPANPIPPSSWRLRHPLVFTSWGWRIDWREDRDADKLIATMVAARVGTVALDASRDADGVGMFDEDVPGKLRDAGFDVCLWAPRPRPSDRAALDDAESTGYIPQVEGAEDYRNTIENLEAGIGTGLSLSTVTTLSGLDTFIRRPDGTEDGESTTVQVEELVDAGCTHAWVECYTGDMRPVDVDRQMFQAAHCGIYHAEPAIGLSRPDVYVETYMPALERFGRRVAAYLAEPMRDIDWAAVKAL